MKRIVFERGAFEDFTDWATIDKNIYRRIVALILDVLREPFSGLANPSRCATSSKAIGRGESTASIGWSTRWTRNS